MTLGSLVSGAFITSILFLLVGLLLFPPLTSFWKSKIPILKNRVVKGVLLVLLFISAFLLAPNSESILGNSNSKELKFDDKRDILIRYIKNNKNDKSLQSIDKLGEIGKLFGHGNNSVKRPRNSFFSQVNDTTINVVRFDPKLFFGGSSIYLNDDETNGRLQNYLIDFYIDSIGKIESKITYITYSKGGTIEFKNDEVPDLKPLLISPSLITKELKFELKNNQPKTKRNMKLE